MKGFQVSRCLRVPGLSKVQGFHVILIQGFHVSGQGFHVMKRFKVIQGFQGFKVIQGDLRVPCYEKVQGDLSSA